MADTRLHHPDHLFRSYQGGCLLGARSEVIQLCLTLCNPMDCSLPGSVHGISQARILEWVVMPSSRVSFRPRYQTCVFYISCIGRRVLYD